jgi:hypothetical protein
MIIKLNHQEQIEELELIKKLSYLIKKKYPRLFVAVLAHGSVGSNEIVSYSDFDGLLIVKNNYKNSRFLKKFKKESLRLIYEFDALQHHGWFEMYEEDLLQFPQTYFPYELFEHASLIYPEKVEFEITFPEKINYSDPFYNLCASLNRKIQQNFYPKNSYQLKSYLSEIMLLPTLYLQSKYQKGIFKKHSFTLIQSHFSQELLTPVVMASKWRLEWRQKQLSNAQKLLLQLLPISIFRKLNEKYLSIKISKHISLSDLNNLSNKLALLINHMENK